MPPGSTLHLLFSVCTLNVFLTLLLDLGFGTMAELDSLFFHDFLMNAFFCEGFCAQFNYAYILIPRKLQALDKKFNYCAVMKKKETVGLKGLFGTKGKKIRNNPSGDRNVSTYHLKIPEASLKVNQAHYNG